MDWIDEGIVLSARAQGETSVILDLLTEGHGRHLGLVKGGRSRTQRPVLQPGNRVRAHWRARLDEHLGNYAVEGMALRAATLMESRAATFGVGHLAALARLLPERDPHPRLFAIAELVLDHLPDPAVGPALMVRFELAVLAELGFGLDLATCAATGATTDLAFVSPKSGRAVSAGAGAPYAERLLALPPFLIGSGSNAAPTAEDIAAGFRLTGFFLARDLFEPRGLAEPPARRAFIAAVAAAAATVNT
jgi:DNA repair protein RecO (recombination protein O)